VTLPLTNSPDSGLTVDSVRGSRLPRIYTPPLRELTPETSYGFAVIDFAATVLNHPLDPWQEEAVIRAGELLPDGSVRYTIVLILVARQNGKTELLVVLALYWLFVETIAMILGTSTKLDYARESWRKAVQLARSIAALRAEIPARGGVRKANGEQELVRAPSGDVDDLDACRYKIAASNEEGGRSLSIGRLILDELRQHHTYDAWDAMEATTSAVDDSQIYCLSNMGTDRSIVLNDKRQDALDAIESGDPDSDICLLEWSSPEGSDPEDLAALAAANPNLGYRKNARRLLNNARRAKRAGGLALTGFQTEHMCLRVKVMNPAYAGWSACLEVGTLDGIRSRLAACIDLSPDGQHATLSAAAVLEDGRVRVETVQEWTGPTAAADLERDLPGWVALVRPRKLGWFPSGPAAAVAARLADRRKAGVRNGWPPPGVSVEDIRGETSAACMGLGKEVDARTLVHSGQAMLDAQIGGAEKLPRGDAWVITRKEGNVDAVYSIAGAVLLARTMPAPVGEPRILRPSGRA
jgi:hypothetical protein